MTSLSMLAFKGLTMNTKPFTIPAPTLRSMREFAKGVISKMQSMDSSALDEPDEWIEWSTEYDINIYRNKRGNIAAAVYPIVPHPNNPALRTTDASRFVKLNLR